MRDECEVFMDGGRNIAVRWKEKGVYFSLFMIVKGGNVAVI
jgi:hypothetical protein